MKSGKTFFVSGYAPYTSAKRSENSFIKKLIAITAALSVCLISLSVYLIQSMPREAFLSIINREEKAQIKDTGYVYPEPTKEVRIKADRLREIRYEDYLEHCYTPLEAEMDNVYVLDNYKKCYLTFDDGPSEVTPLILDVLKQYKAKATFFVTGINAQTNPDLIKSIVSSGNAIGNHTYSHQYDSVYDSVSSFENEVKKCQNAINTALGKEYKNLIFRFPGGYGSLTSEDTKASYRASLKKMGYKYIDWSCLTGDSNTTEPTEEYLINTLKSGIGDSVTGDIVVLMHDSATKEMTARTLPKIIEYLYEEGYSLETLSNIKGM